MKKNLVPVLLFLILSLFSSPVQADDAVPSVNAAAAGAHGAGQGTAADIPPAEEDLEFNEDVFDEYETQDHAGQRVADPVYYFNRAMFTFNDYLYFYGLKPIAQGYKAVVPTPARKGVSNFFNNLLFPVRFVNNILQGRFEDAGTEFSAFFVNSTVGILGFNDFAQKYMNIRLKKEDLGQTLGRYNIDEGFYLVLPVLGPSSLRDALGGVGDMFMTPTTYVTPWELAWGMRGVDTVNRTSFRIGDYETLKDAALDPYTALKNAYIQNRRALIKE